jgi:hypothetical protein
MPWLVASYTRTRQPTRWPGWALAQAGKLGSGPAPNPRRAGGSLGGKIDLGEVGLGPVGADAQGSPKIRGGKREEPPTLVLPGNNILVLFFRTPEMRWLARFVYHGYGKPLCNSHGGGTWTLLQDLEGDPFAFQMRCTWLPHGDGMNRTARRLDDWAKVLTDVRHLVCCV